MRHYQHTQNDINKRTKVHQWKIDILCDCHVQRTTFYIGQEYAEMCKRLGEACLSTVVDKVYVFRDGEQIKSIEVQ